MPSGRNKAASCDQLYACGSRVHMPTVSSTPNGAKTVTRFTKGAVEHATPSLNCKRTSKHADGGVKSSLKRQLGELGKTLAFSEDVISTRSPQSLSYQQAKDGLKRAFRPITTTEEGKKGVVKPSEFTGDGGRHDCRRGVKKHPLCHLNNAYPSVRLDNKQEGISESPSPTLAPPRDTSLASFSCPSHVPSLPSNMLYHRVKVLPASKSIPWEEVALQKMSSSTAAALSGRAKTGRMSCRDQSEVLCCDQWIATHVTVLILHLHVTLTTHTVQCTSTHSGTIIAWPSPPHFAIMNCPCWSSLDVWKFLYCCCKFSHASKANIIHTFLQICKEGESDEASSPVKEKDTSEAALPDYITSLQLGARPVCQIHTVRQEGQSHEIVLDNDARFEKVHVHVFT